MRWNCEGLGVTRRTAVRLWVAVLLWMAGSVWSRASSAQQGFVVVSQAHLTAADGSPANAQVCAQAVDLMGKAVSLQVGNAAGGVTTTATVCVNAVSGAWSMQLPNTAIARPINSCFSFSATDNVTGRGLIGPGYACVQPTTDAASKWCTAAGCNFDLLPPMSRPTLASIVQGPAGTVAIASTVTGAPGTAAKVVNTGTGSAAVLSFTVPAGMQGPLGPNGGPKGDKGDKGNPGDITTSSGNLIGNGAGVYAVQTMQAGEVRYFGDSLTGRPVTIASWPSRLVADLGGVATNRAVGGSFAGDVANMQVFGVENPQDTGEPARTLMVGTNEMLYKGAGAYEAVYSAVHQGILAWLATPASSKVFGAACNYGAGWAVEATYGAGLAVKSSTQGAKLTCSLSTGGGAIYLWYRMIDGDAGSFAYSVDGGSATTVNTASSPALGLSNSNPSQSVGMVRIPVNAGAHYVQVVPAVSSGTVSIVAVGTAPRGPLYGGPVVYSAGVPKPSSAQASPGQVAAGVAYNADSLADAALLRGDGLRIVPVDVQRYYNPDGTDPGNGTAQLADVVHPAPLGEQALANAFEAAMQFTPRIATGRRKQTIVTGDYAVLATDSEILVRSSDGYGSATISLPYRSIPGIVQRILIVNDNGGTGAIVRLVPSGGSALYGPGLSPDGSLYLFHGESVELSFQDDGFRYRVYSRQLAREGMSVNGDSFGLDPSARTYIALGGGSSTVTLPCSIGSTIPAPFPEGSYTIRALGALQVIAGSGCAYQGPASLTANTGLLVGKAGNQWFALMGPS